MCITEFKKKSTLPVLITVTMVLIILITDVNIFKTMIVI